jgi:ribosomal protein S18 acetylase RimI-like enzyme
MEIRTYEPRDESAVVALWGRCGLLRPWNDPLKDIRRKLEVRPDLFLVGEFDGAMVATVMAGYDGHRGWINYLAVSPDHRREGFGRKIMQAAEERLRREGCPKINLQVRSCNKDVIDFYQRIGFQQDDVVSLGKRLKVDAPPDDECVA